MHLFKLLRHRRVTNYNPDVHRDVPFELVLEILELVVLRHRNASRPFKLVLVSKAVQRCIDPLLHEYITLKSSESVHKFARTLRGQCLNKPPDFFRSHVKAICFMTRCSPQDVRDILTTCSKITSLASQVAFGLERLTGFNLPLQRFAQPFSLRTGHPSFDSALDTLSRRFRNLTHLGIHNSDPDWNIPVRDHLPGLTHLSLSLGNNITADRLAGISAQLPNKLRVCIINVGWWISSERLKSVCAFEFGQCAHDIRIVFALYTQEGAPVDELPSHIVDHLIERHDYVSGWAFGSDWGRPSPERQDTWDEAEELVQQKRAQRQAQVG